MNRIPIPGEHIMGATIELDHILGLKIVDTSVKTDPDTGRSHAIVEFSDGSTTEGYTDKPAMRRLLERAQANA